MIINNNSNFLKPTQEFNGKKIIFLDEGREQVSKFPYPDGSQKMEAIFKVNCGTEQKTLRVNKTSQQMLAEKWGRDTKGWVGKIGLLIVAPTPNGDKKMFLIQPTDETAVFEE